MSDFQQLLLNIDAATQIVHNPSSSINLSERKEAENFLLNLRTSTAPFEFCHFVLENDSTSNYVQFQIISILKESILREWHTLNSEEIENLWKYLLHFVYEKNYSLPAFVSNEILLVIAMIIKRGTFDGKSGETEKIYESVETMLGSNNPQMITLACQILLNICTEYCTTWTSNIGLTWDFHVRAKRHFELSDLKRIFELTLRVLYNAIGSLQSSSPSQSSDSATMKLFERFLNLSLCILSWNFGSKNLPKRLTYVVEFSSAFSLHPPDTWRDLFLNEDVLKFFFMLHSHLKMANSELKNISLQCLVQLASLCGSIFPNDVSRDKYLALFVATILQVFLNVNRDEAVNFGEMIQKLFTYNPLAFFRRFDKNLFDQFFDLLTRITIEFCEQATLESFSHIDDTVYQEAYLKLLDGWAVQLKTDSRSEENGNGKKMLAQHADAIFDCFLKCHFSAPVGQRPFEINKDIEEDFNENEDDKDCFAETLLNIGIFGRHSIGRNINTLTSLLVQTLNKYINLFEPDQNSCEIAQNNLLSVQEDMHWLLLIIANFLTLSEIETLFYVPVDIHNFACNNGQCSELASSQTFLVASMTDPIGLSIFPPTCVDPIVGLISCVLKWSNMEKRLLEQNRIGFLSPQVSETTCWSLKRILSAYCESDERYATPSKPCIVKETFQTGTMTSSAITMFVLDKFYSVLKFWSNETKLNKEAASMLNSFIDRNQKGDEMAKQDRTIGIISEINLEKLCPEARKELLKSIVKICLSHDSSFSKATLFDKILAPLRGHFDSIMNQLQGSKASKRAKHFSSSEMLNLLDCFSGVVQGIGAENTRDVCCFIMPVLKSCIDLMSLCKSEQVIIDAILQLYVDVTARITACIGNQADAELFYECILNMLKIYALNNTSKYLTMTQFNEEKISDLILFLKILSNLLSKDVFMVLGGLNVGLGLESPDPKLNIANVIILGLQTVLPLMSPDFLKYPPVCSLFFKLIASLCQMYTLSFYRFETQMRQSFFTMLKSSLTFEFGIDVVKLSLQSLHSLATFANHHHLDSPDVKNSLSDLIDLIDPIFKTCLKAGCEIELLHDASTLLFSLICLNRIGFQNYVSQIIERHEDVKSREILIKSFERLLQPMQHQNLIDAKQVQYRRENLTFRDRFETFLDDIQGILKIL